MRQIRIAMLVAVAGLALAGMTAGAASAAMKALSLGTNEGPLKSGAHSEWTVSSLSLTGKSGTVSCKRLEPPWKDIVEEPIKEGGAWAFTLSSGSTSSECNLGEEPVEVTPGGFPWKLVTKKTTLTATTSVGTLQLNKSVHDVSCAYSVKKLKGTFAVGEPGSSVPFVPTFTSQKLKLEGKTPGCEEALLLSMSFAVSSNFESVRAQWKEPAK